MNKFTLRVIPDVQETVFRDIDILENQSLYLLHQAIVKAYELDGEQMASFFETNEFWEQLLEIPMINFGEEKIKLMHEYKLADLLKKEDDKLLYVYDFLLFRQFFIEVMSISDAGDKKRFPVVSNRFGDAPKTKDSEMNAENAESILLEALLGKDFVEDALDDDPFNDEFDEDDFSSWEDEDEPY